MVNSKIDLSFMEFNKGEKEETVKTTAKTIKKFISFDSVGEPNEDIG